MNNSNIIWLSTKDNPFNPIKQFREWFSFDFINNYNSNNVLARFARVSEDLTEAENQEEIESAIDRIMAVDATHMFCKMIMKSDGTVVDVVKSEDLK